MNTTRIALAALAAALVAAPTPAQDYRWDRIEDLGIQYRVYRKLKRLPLKLGQSEPHLVARYEPLSPSDFIWGKYGRFSWELNVYAFGGADAARAEKGKAGRSISARRTSRSFREFVTKKGGRRFVVKGKKYKKNKGKGKKLPYEWWEFTDTHKMSNGYGQSFDQLWYNFAAVYDLPNGKEVALVLHVPIKKTRPGSKERGWALNMLRSLSLLDEDDDGAGGHARKDQYADTPAKKKALQHAKANIADMIGKGWDYFTTPSYIVIFSWDPTKPDMERKQLRIAKDLAQKMEKIREKYMEDYPPHEKMGNPYSVLRICFNYEQFQQYGGSSGGVVGWFSPTTKELVIFTGDLLMGKGSTDAVAFHEGWHQYADSYFGVELQRWFDEGTGDYYGSWVLKGRRWQYVPSKMRRSTLRRLLNQEAWVPFSEIVTWNKDKFYGAKASDYYAQGYAMIDFLRRGPEKMKRKWDPKWTPILETYRKKVLEHRNAKKAVEETFAQFKQEDWEKMERAWVEWVKKEIL